MKKIIFIKYLNNKCSDKEFEEFIIWVKKETYKKDGKKWSFEHWKRFEPELNIHDKKKFSTLLDKIHHEINLKHREREGGKVIILSKVIKCLSRAAAILFIPLIGIVFYILSNINSQINKISNLTIDAFEVFAPVGSRTVVQLSDEAYFDVAHNPDKPYKK